MTEEKNRTHGVFYTMTPDVIDKAVACLCRGGLVALPTETVYGLAADACQDDAIERLYAAKGRPAFNPLIAHVHNLTAAQEHGIFSPLAERLAHTFWPGPLTLVVPFQEASPVCFRARAGLKTIALRVPGQALTRKLLEVFQGPLVMPSANLSNRLSPTCAEHVDKDLGDKTDMILDAGPCSVGIESSVVMVRGEHASLLRPGGLPREQIEKITGPLETGTSEPESFKMGGMKEKGQDYVPRSPGQLRHHYAPRTPLRFEARTTEKGEVYLGFGPDSPGQALNLSPSGNLEEASRRLFAYLHRLDQEKALRIAVAPIPKTGLGEAINDRLKRAAGKRTETKDGA